MPPFRQVLVQVAPQAAIVQDQFVAGPVADGPHGYPGQPVSHSYLGHGRCLHLNRQGAKGMAQPAPARTRKDHLISGHYGTHVRLSLEGAGGIGGQCHQAGIGLKGPAIADPAGFVTTYHTHRLEALAEKGTSIVGKCPLDDNQVPRQQTGIQRPSRSKANQAARPVAGDQGLGPQGGAQRTGQDFGQDQTAITHLGHVQEGITLPVSGSVPEHVKQWSQFPLHRHQPDSFQVIQHLSIIPQFEVARQH